MNSCRLFLLQTQLSAACNALHTVEARVCRWLLQTQDVVESDKIQLTQEALSLMLGVQRTAVSQCAMALHERGLIEYSRGNIKILSRSGLEKCACECYEVVREKLAEWRGPEARPRRTEPASRFGPAIFPPLTLGPLRKYTVWTAMRAAVSQRLKPQADVWVSSRSLRVTSENARHRCSEAGSQIYPMMQTTVLRSHECGLS